LRSQHADAFNHDDDAAGHDAEVQDESHPLRAGYGRTLAAVAARAEGAAAILELGSGTGNLTVALPATVAITCVDVSPRMVEFAGPKLRFRQNVRFVVDDMLHYVCSNSIPVDAVVSTYALHHLTDREKLQLAVCLKGSLGPGGRLIVGDLAFETARARDHLLEKYAGKYGSLASDIRNEFFWDLEVTGRDFGAAGYKVEQERVSELSWVLVATRPN